MGRYDDTGNGRLFIALALVAVIVALVSFWFYLDDDQNDSPEIVSELSVPEIQSPETEEMDAEMVNEVESAVEPAGENVMNQATDSPDPALSAPPALEQSDSWMQQRIAELAPDLAELAMTSQTAEKIMQVVNDFSQSLRLHKHMRFFKIKQAFVADKDADGWFLGESSYRRYDKLAQAFSEIDARQAMESYRHMQPLLEEVYSGFGYPEEYSLDDLFKKAAAEMIAAPVITGRIGLVRPSVRFKFAAPHLEQLSPVQKQMLRMGPANTRKIQNKLRELVQMLAAQQHE